MALLCRKKQSRTVSSCSACLGQAPMISAQCNSKSGSSTKQPPQSTAPPGGTKIGVFWDVWHPCLAFNWRQLNHNSWEVAVPSVRIDLRIDEETIGNHQSGSFMYPCVGYAAGYAEWKFWMHEKHWCTHKLIKRQSTTAIYWTSGNLGPGTLWVYLNTNVSICVFKLWNFVTWHVTPILDTSIQSFTTFYNIKYFTYFLQSSINLFNPPRVFSIGLRYLRTTYFQAIKSLVRQALVAIPPNLKGLTSWKLKLHQIRPGKWERNFVRPVAGRLRVRPRIIDLVWYGWTWRKERIWLVVWMVLSFFIHFFITWSSAQECSTIWFCASFLCVYSGLQVAGQPFWLRPSLHHVCDVHVKRQRHKQWSNDN